MNTLILLKQNLEIAIYFLHPLKMLIYGNLRENEAANLIFNQKKRGPSMEKPSILKFAVLRKRALKLLHLPFHVFLNLGNDKHL